MSYFPVKILTSAQGHDGKRIADHMAQEFRVIIGEHWQPRVLFAVTDGAKNVVNASTRVAKSRRCLQHGIQLLLKHFCASQQDLATALGHCNYLAKYCKLSQAFKVRWLT